jgi:hypothetical protein
MPPPGPRHHPKRFAPEARTRSLPSGLALAACLALAGCAHPGKRHHPAELASYRPDRFQTTLATAAGRAAERAAARSALAQAERPEATGEQIVAALAALQLQNFGLERAPALLQRLFAEDAARFIALPPSEQHARLALAHGLDPGSVAPAVEALLPRLATPREFAAASAVLLRADPGYRDLVRRNLAARGDRDDPRLEALARRLDPPPPTPPPPLADWFRPDWMPGRPIVYSLQRPDRRHPGLALVRAADGRLVRGADGRLFHVPQLAFAASALPGTLTNGNTPQGLFTVVGAGTARNRWIGPTPYLHSMLPVEAGVADFLHRTVPADIRWERATYLDALPARWRDHLPVHEAWLAGLAGRNEILVHGMTQDPSWAEGHPWAPLAPSAGCLVTLEHWSPESGHGLRSDQLLLAQAFTRDGHDRGYLVVLELDDVPRPVTLDDLRALLAELGEPFP